MNSAPKKTVIITAWLHSCRLHDEHIALYGTDCETTAEANGEALHEMCCDAGVTTGPAHVYRVDAGKLADLLQDSPTKKEGEAW